MIPTHAGPGDSHEASAEAGPQQSEGPYHDLFHASPQPAWVYDLDTLRCSEVNAAATEVSGYSRAELLGKRIGDLHPADDVARLLGGGSEPGRGGAPPGAARLLTRAGGWLQVETRSRRLTFRGRSACLVVAHDIGDRVAIEAELRAPDQRRGTPFGQSPLGVLHFDRGLRVVGCNRPLAQALGFEASEELIGFELERLRDQRILPVLRQALDGQPSVYEGPYRATHRGVVAWIDLRVAPLHDAGGQVLGGVAVIEDITARKAAQTMLAQQKRTLEQINLALRQRTVELETALQSRNRLYATLNHELRTPISAIMLYNDLLLGGAFGPLTAEQRQSVGNAQGAAQHLLELVQDVLDLARLDAGRIELALESVDLDRLFADLLTTIRPLAERHGSTITMESPRPGSPVVTDARRVRQIVLNLLSNALKFGEGRPVTLSCTPLPGGGVEVAVADQGRGIAPADHGRIFEDFVQIGGGHDGGSGLGLSISRRLADLLGATLSVEAEPGSGSTFRLRLPATPPPGRSRDAVPGFELTS